jgi:hypothetical protein
VFVNAREREIDRERERERAGARASERARDRASERERGRERASERGAGSEWERRVRRRTSANSRNRVLLSIIDQQI